MKNETYTTLSEIDNLNNKNHPDLITEMYNKIEIGVIKPSFPFPTNKQYQNTPCDLWIGKTLRGYGVFNGEGYAGILAHRFVYQLKKNKGKKLKESDIIAHLCNNKLCVNPDHLIKTTKRDNNSHMRVHDPAFKHLKKKLTDQEVIDIRNDYFNGTYNQAELADFYGVTKRMISMITTGTCYKYLNDQSPTGHMIDRTSTGQVYATSKLNATQVREIRTKYSSGYSLSDLATLYNVSKPVVSRIVNNQSYKNVK